MYNSRYSVNIGEPAETRYEFQGGRRMSRPHHECKYKPGDKWCVPGQMLLESREEGEKECILHQAGKQSGEC